MRAHRGFLRTNRATDESKLISLTSHERPGACFIFAGPCCALEALPTRRIPSMYHRLGPVLASVTRLVKELRGSNSCLIEGLCNNVFSGVRCIAIFRACFVRIHTLTFVKSCGGLPHSIHIRHTRTNRHNRHFSPALPAPW